MPIWVSPLNVADVAALSQRTAPAHIGIVFTAIGDDWIEGSLPLDERTRNAEGMLDHGAIAIIAETLASVGATMCVDTARHACLGQSLLLQHRTPVERGPLTARARPLWLQPRSQLWEIAVHDPAGAPVCVAQLTLAVVDRPTAAATGRDASTER